MAIFTAIKNKAQGGGAMKGSLDYVKRKDKTLRGDRQLVTGWNCVAQSAYDEMMTTKRRYGKTDGRMFYQFVQSFSPEEDVSPEEVHAIGLKLGRRLFPDFEVVVATHVDADHLHSHLIVNSVSWKDGHKLHQNAADLQRQRQISDEICAVHGLMVLEPPKKYAQEKKMRPGEYRSAVRGESWKFRLINAIDLCMRKAKTRAEFFREMEKRGYQVRWEDARKYITYTIPKGKKCRDDRLHDERYRKEVMEREFRIREAMLHGEVEETEPATRATAPPMLAPCPTVEQWTEMVGILASVYQVIVRQHNLMLEQSKTLENISSALYALTKQMEKPVQDLSTIRWEVEQAGRPNERRRLWLPKIHLPELSTVTLKGVVLTLMALVVSGILLYASVTVWNNLLKPRLVLLQ